jgi:putative flippase GtrA
MSLARLQMALYAINGAIATIAHYVALYICIERYNLNSAGFANFLASLVGIFVSFMGNRYIVFKNTNQKITRQFFKFSLVYVLIAFMHGGFLYVWSDILSKSYNHGFVIVVIIQFVFGYFASRKFVFQESVNNENIEVNI